MNRIDKFRGLKPEQIVEFRRVMLWLAEQGLTAEEISQFQWRDVDFYDKHVIQISRPEFGWKLTRKGIKQREKKVIVEYWNAPFREFFDKSKIWCTWVFPAKLPTCFAQRRLDCLRTPVEEVEKIIAPVVEKKSKESRKNC